MVDEGFVMFNDAAEKKIDFYEERINFSFIIRLITIAPKTMALHLPSNHPWSNLLSCITSSRPVYFWLVVVCILINRQPS
jgi:hypothetical protein